MARYERGVLGSFNGKVGTVVGAKWKGIEYMKIKPGKSTKPPTQLQIEQRAKFTLLIRFVSTMGKLLEQTFKGSAIKMTGVNSAFRYIYDNAIVGTYPSFALNFSKVLISKGNLINVGNPTAVASGGGLIKFNWADNSGVALSNANDKSILVVYCEELKRTLYVTSAGGRSAQTASIDASMFVGKTVETWLGFIAADDSDVASSIYTGELVVV